MMYQKKLPVVLNNGIGLFQEILNGKWKIHLIYYICSGNKRPAELQRKIPEADRRVLKTQLDELVQHGLISKTVHDGFPPKVEYVLTSLGESILPVICQMHHWGEAYKEEIEGDKKQLMSNV